MPLIDIVKYDGAPGVFAWKFPDDSLSTWTQIVVNESQQAVLFYSGKALDVFDSGRYVLDTANIPILSKLINLPYGGKTPFKAEVWYVNRAYALDIKWGTSTPLQILDLTYNLYLPVRSFGQFGIRIVDSKRFLTKLVGTMPEFNQQQITEYFRGLYLMTVKDVLSSYILQNKVSTLQLSGNLAEISNFLLESMQPVFAEYGIELVNFYVNDISICEDDPSVIRLKSALSEKAEMDIVGYTYKEKRTFDTLEGAAKNQGGAGNFMGVGVGMGMGNTVGGVLAANLEKNAVETQQPTAFCASCNGVLPASAAFCPTCGTKTQKSCKCGASLSAGMQFCPTCGEKQS